jgi:peptide/nickel transport system substrate-binding protein
MQIKVRMPVPRTGISLRAKALVACLPLVLAASGLTACGSASGGGGQETSGSSGPPQRGGTLTIATPLEPVTLDPNSGELDAGTQHVLGLVFDRLLEVEPGSSKLMPSLAESWKLDREANTATFQLRKAEFSDGSPVTANDVKFSFERALDPKVDPNFSEALSGLIQSISTPDQQTIVLHFAGPTPAIFPYLTIATLSIVSQRAFDRLGAERFAELPTDAGSGPFKVVKWDKGQSVELVRNPHYWQKPEPYLDKIVTVYVPNDNTRILDVKSGQVDVADEVPYSQLESIESTPGVKLLVTPIDAIDTVFLKAIGPLKSVGVRQALNYATPKEDIQDVVFGGNGDIVNSIIPPMRYWDSSIKPYPFDVEKAKSLLAREGLSEGFSLQLLIQSGDETSRQIASILQSAWGEIGVDVSIQTLDAASLGGRWVNPTAQWQAILFPPSAVSSDIPSEDEFAINLSGKFFGEVFAFSDAKLESLITQIEGTWNEDTRRKLFSEFQAEELANPIGVPIIVASSRTVLRENVEEFGYVSLNRWTLAKTWLRR